MNSQDSNGSSQDRQHVVVRQENQDETVEICLYQVIGSANDHKLTVPGYFPSISDAGDKFAALCGIPSQTKIEIDSRGEI
jgi:hypothetical protein